MSLCHNSETSKKLHLQFYIKKSKKKNYFIAIRIIYNLFVSLDDLNFAFATQLPIIYRLTINLLRIILVHSTPKKVKIRDFNFDD